MTLPPLGDLEHELVTLLWAHGPATAAALRKRLPRKLADPTVRTVLRRLEEKGYVDHVVEAGTFIYRAKETRQQVAADAVRNILDKFCDGSLEKMLSGLIESSVIDPRHVASFPDRLKKRFKPR